MGKIVFVLLFFSPCINLFSQSNVTAHIYKKIDSISLDFKLYKPDSFNVNENYSTVILFHGGGFNTRYENQFRRHAKYFNSRNFISITPVYRIKSLHGTSAIESCDDAKDLIDYILLNAEKLNIDKNKIFVGGGSAGGLLALSTTFWNMRSNIVKGLILYNPIVDTGPNSAFSKRRSGKYNLDISPIHNLDKNFPPAIVFHGSLDEIEPVNKIRKFKQTIEEYGIRCDVIEYPGQGHSFFNSQEFFVKTSREVDKFLSTLGYLKN